MDMFGKIVTEIWDEWIKDTTKRYYAECSSETLKILQLNLKENNFRSVGIFQEKKVDLNVSIIWPEPPLRMSIALMREFIVTPYLFVYENIFKIKGNGSISILRNDKIQKGKITIRRLNAEDRFGLSRKEWGQ